MQKVILLFCLLIGLPSLMGATPPERILPLSQSIHSVEYYQSQLKIWKNELNTNKTDAAAWLNYYTAARNINILNASEINDLGSILEAIQSNIPNTFEALYIEFWQSDFFNRPYQILLDAHELAPHRWEIYHDLITYYKTKDDREAVKKYSQLLYDSGQLSGGILDWNYNALMSIGSKGILLTNGDNDTYPAWVLQEIKGIRKDVHVINLYLLLAEDVYRHRLFKQLNIAQPYQKSPALSLENQLKSLVNHLLQYANQSLYLSVATSSNLRTELSDNLYLTGLAFQHSNQQIDNLSILDYNYHKTFRTESLKTPLAYDASQSVVNHMNMNYIPSFALLYRYYKNNNRENEAVETKNLITDIATRADRLESIENILSKRDAFTSKKQESVFNLRDLDKGLIHLDNKFYASKTEVSNAEYRTFLHDLVDQNKFDVLETCRINPTDWIALLPSKHQGLSDEIYFKRGHPEGDKTPIVNITFQAAQLYCQWLTEQYNQSDHRKKRFKTVLFRLPTKKEWITAAKGGRNNAVYPWGGPFNRNEKGCLLANFNPSVELTKDNSEELTEDNSEELTEISADDDGGFFTVPVDAYFPNDLGFYNMAGNAAEMINQEGVTMGGGWNDPSYYMQIGVEHNTNLPNPNVGFRIFMDIIEE